MQTGHDWMRYADIFNLHNPTKFILACNRPTSVAAASCTKPNIRGVVRVRFGGKIIPPLYNGNVA